jgi:hypothetical protein
MRALANRVIRLEAKANDAADNVFRLVFSRVDKPLNWATSKCTRTRQANGSVFEYVRLDGSDHNVTEDELDRFVKRFLVVAGREKHYR